jgi:hypothetical protein
MIGARRDLLEDMLFAGVKLNEASEAGTKSAAAR